MLKKNTPLKILDLSYNNFAHDSGLIIGDSLFYNNNLRGLNMSNNRLGDLGVRNLTYPLVLHGMQENTSKTENLKVDKGSFLSFKNKDWPKPYDLCNDKYVVSKLRAVNLEDNYMTQESLRTLTLLLDVNKNSVI
jgi:hypothetical protein